VLRRLMPAKGRASRGAVAIMAGTAFGQLVAIAVSPLLSRLYSPADFGIFSVVNAFAMVLGTVAALRYEMAIPLPRADDDARAVLVVAAIVTLGTTLATTLALWVLGPVVADLLGTPRVEPWLVWVPLIAAAITVFQMLNQWALRHRRYAATARRNFVSALGTVAVQILLGLRLAGPGGLVAGLGVGQAAGAASLLAGSGLARPVAPARLRQVARRFRRFPAMLAPAGLLNAVGIYVPVLLLAALYGPQDAGWFGFTQRIVTVPVTLVGQAVAQVYLSELALSRRSGGGRQAALFRTASMRLGLLGIIGGLALLLFARPLFPFVFGSAWERSGAMAQALGVSTALQLAASPLSQTLIVYERTTWQLSWDVARLVLVAGAGAVASATGADALAAVWSISIASAACYAVSWALSRRTVLQATADQAAAPGHPT